MATHATVSSAPGALYLSSLAGAPPPPYPRATDGLVDLLVGREMPIRAQQYAYWRRWLRAVPRAQGWRPHHPPHWPEEVQPHMPSHITPRDWWLKVPPRGKGVEGYRTWAPPGAGVLEAISVGWPVTPSELHRAAVAVQLLMLEPLFVIWAYDLGLDRIPLPMEASVSLEKKLRARRTLEQDPLRAGARTTKWGLPPAMHDAVRLLVACPRKSAGTGRSSRAAFRGLPGAEE